MSQEMLLTLAVVAGLLACFYGVYRNAKNEGFYEGANFVLWCVRKGHAKFDGDDLVFLDEDANETGRITTDEYLDFEFRRIG